MLDWTSTMQQTFEYYIVDPGTWCDDKKLNTVRSCTITRDSDTDTLGSATIDADDVVGECYIRVYLVCIQNGVTYKNPLGTFLVQTPTSKFNGALRSVSMQAYSPLLELKESQPPLGYYIPKNTNIMEFAYMTTREHVRAPVVKGKHETNVYANFVASTDDTWLTLLKDFIGSIKYRFDLDEMGRILFAPKQETASLQPIWTYNDDNSSIIYPELTMEHDLYNIPNAVEIVYSNSGDYYYTKVVNNDANSLTSTVNRGREIVHRVTDLSAIGNPTHHQIDDYAKQLLKELSSIEYSITYTHGYCPVRLGDCVRLNYSRAGLTNIKAKVISQSIKCEPGCPVTEKAVFTVDLWR